MKSIYVLTAFDCSTSSFIGKYNYSSRQTAEGSFKALKDHLIHKHSLQDEPVTRWSFTDDKDHKSDVIGKFNVTLTKESVSSEVIRFTF